MSISIQTNVNSVVAQENLRVTNDFQGKTIERLTSGYRINSSGDDAAGLAVANKFRSDIAELSQGVRNANDGLSQLQIVDSGLNNISKILDRLKTLATQAASSTFTGDRTILNNEYTSLLSEIDRQAANIGLGSGDTAAGRNNTDISVYIGGGSAQANSKIGISLSATTDLVNRTGLGITGTTVVGGVAQQVIFGSVDVSSTSTKFLTGATQVFHVATETGQLDVTVNGGVNGLLGSEIVTQLNDAVVGKGINFSLETTAGANLGKLQVSSTNSFSVWDDVATGGTVVAAAIASTAAMFNVGKYNFDAGTLTAIVTGSAAHTITITKADLTVITLTLSAETTEGATTNIESNMTAMRTTLAGTGIDAVRAGNDLVFMSATDFTVVRGATVSGGGLAGIPASTNTSATDPTGNTSPTAAGLDALTKITTAVANLGNVQGKVGTGQNKLLYSIQLAQSQLSGYAAAESRIRDADVAVEAANLTKVQVLTQASIAAMAQANSAPQQVLALLRG